LIVLLARFAPGQYAGSKSCAPCHPLQSASQAKTGHARSLASGGDKADWAFGAGDQAVTYVSRINDEFYLEHGLTWFAASKSMKITPGHRNEAGERYRTFDPDAAILRCFQCHSTGPLRLTESFSIQPSEPGVNCEACHGPGADHKAIRNPRKLPAAQINDLCGTCHRMPAPAGTNTDWSNPWNARHQPLYLAESACFKNSQGRLSCLTCHPAHQPVSRRASDYDRQCSSCHPKVRHKTPVKNQSCAGCHMPAVKPHPDLTFSNHWIGVYSPSKPLPGSSGRP
jgi:hypothetical protein